MCKLITLPDYYMMSVRTFQEEGEFYQERNQERLNWPVFREQTCV